ncbi:amidohydrolase [Bradyrhizobium sp. AUGA SZCCT0274]|uniref:nitrilase-related carbon-nitrogen hydrolase n=1 Tax=Bradyrhizobium sp. AUGA SZCCT0274 TaxID=2807670 RepID=UPI001BA5CF91|nr:nitrilase-related carbon-nitrogen hydrolase [Bradyrhizobium sp. AUGA SZCCT0274]MBR1239059.1 amidohydrolase [Bradyrhizobium sp. AUGA SZCCT0274]
MASERFKAASIQFEPTMFEKQRNIRRLLEMTSEAAAAGARLIVTPEMGTTGYCWYDRAEVKPFVETVPGPTTDVFHSLAKQFGCYIVVGMPEVDASTDLYYNTAVLIGPSGVVGKHRKSHPYISEPKWAASGDIAHIVFDTEIGRIALLVCMDLHFFETARLEALAGADVICHISNWLQERAPAPYWINRAFENGCYVIESNRWGLERTVQFSGGSCIIEPDGNVQAVLDSGDGIVHGEIDLTRARKRQVLSEAIFEDRRPELYANLMTNSFTWNPRDFFKLYGYQPLPPGQLSRAAVVQFTPTDDVEQNLARIEALAREAVAQEKPDLIVFPELSMTGIGAPGHRALDIKDQAVTRLVRLAARLRVHIIAGFAERAAEGLFNTAVLAGPEGLVGSYRKIHLNARDKAWASAGSDWKVFDLPIGRVGLLIGHDALFPEAVRSLSLLGCDLVACPAAIAGQFTGAHEGTSIRHNYPIPTGADPHHWHAFRVRGGESNVYFAFANVYDPDRGYLGKSAVFGPDAFAFPRQESAILDDQGFAAASVDTTNLDTPYPTNIVRRKDLVMMRLPHHYPALVKWHQ